jgi:hypothetical protein
MQVPIKEDGMRWEQGSVWCGCHKHGAKCRVPQRIFAGAENQEMLIAFAEIVKREFPPTKEALVRDPCVSGHNVVANMKPQSYWLHRFTWNWHMISQDSVQAG